MRRISYLISFLVLAFLGQPLFSQHLQTVDLLYLEGGNFVKGHIIDSLTDKHNFMVDVGGIVPLSVDRKLVLELRAAHATYLVNKSGRKAPTQGHFFEATALFMPAKSYRSFNDENRMGAGAEFSYGRFVKPWLTASVGTGINYYDEPIIPAFGRVRAYLPNTVSAPFLSLQGGYGILAEKLFEQREFETSRGGWFWQPDIGIRLASKGEVTTHLSVGYRFQTVTYAFDYPENWWTIAEKTRFTYRSFAMRVGLVF